MSKRLVEKGRAEKFVPQNYRFFSTRRIGKIVFLQNDKNFLVGVLQQETMSICAYPTYLLKIISLFCKRDLQKRPIFSKETYTFKESTNRSHPIPYIPATTLHRIRAQFPWHTLQRSPRLLARAARARTRCARVRSCPCPLREPQLPMYICEYTSMHTCIYI